MSAIVALSLIAAVAWAMLCWRERYEETAWLPAELHEATLAYSEHTFVAKRPFLLGAVIDRAYQRRDGVLVLVEFKRRGHAAVHRADVVELSAQMLALAQATGEAVAAHAYVALIGRTGAPRRVVRVSLLSVAELTVIRKRYLDLVSGTAMALPTGQLWLCSACPHALRCKV